MDVRKLLADLVGTFVFFLIGLMSILSTKAFPGGPDLLVIAFGFGLGLFVAINIGGAISGGHFNPAVTIGAVLDKRLGASVNPARSIASAVIGGGLGSIWIYIVGPVIGAVAGWAVYKALLDEPARA